MELNIHEVIKGPIISDKAQKLNRTLKQLVLEVHTSATKPMIRQALKKLFNVYAERVRTVVRKYRPSTGVARRRRVARPSIKRFKLAYITLEEGQALNLFEQAGAAAVEENKKGDSAGSAGE